MVAIQRVGSVAIMRVAAYFNGSMITITVTITEVSASHVIMDALTNDDGATKAERLFMDALTIDIDDTATVMGVAQPCEI